MPPIQGRAVNALTQLKVVLSKNVPWRRKKPPAGGIGGGPSLTGASPDRRTAVQGASRWLLLFSEKDDHRL